MQTEVWRESISAESPVYANFSRCFASEQLIHYGCIFICQADNRGQVIVELWSTVHLLMNHHTFPGPHPAWSACSSGGESCACTALVKGSWEETQALSSGQCNLTHADSPQGRIHCSTTSVHCLGQLTAQEPLIAQPKVVYKYQILTWKIGQVVLFLKKFNYIFLFKLVMHVIYSKYYKFKYKIESLKWFEIVSLKTTFKSITTKWQTGSKVAKFLVALIWKEHEVQKLFKKIISEHDEE